MSHFYNNNFMRGATLPFTNAQVNGAVHQAGHLAQSLVMRGLLPGHAASQICDGFVSDVNIQQAQQAMQRAAQMGDRGGYMQAATLCQALQIAKSVQDPLHTMGENMRDSFADQAIGMFGVPTHGSIGTPGVFGGGAGQNFVVGVALAGALALMCRRR